MASAGRGVLTGVPPCRGTGGRIPCGSSQFPNIRLILHLQSPCKLRSASHQTGEAGHRWVAAREGSGKSGKIAPGEAGSGGTPIGGCGRPARFARILRLLELLQGRGRHDAVSLAAEPEVGRRTVQRDLEVLRVSGIRLDTTPTGGAKSCRATTASPSRV